MRNDDKISKNIDWITVGFYAFFVIIGWLNIFAAVYNPENSQNIFDFSINSGKQIIWIGTSLLIIVLISAIDYKFYSSFSYLIYGIIIFICLVTIFLGTEVKGSKSWFEIGSLRVQPAEFAKFATALALATYLGGINIKFEKLSTKLIAFAILGLPCLLILLQNETGTVLVFSAFILVLYREGLSPWFLIIGVLATALFIFTLLFSQQTIFIGIACLAFIIIAYLLLSLQKKTTRIKNVLYQVAITLVSGALCIGIVISVNFVLNNVLQDHQKKRIQVLIDPELDPKGKAYQVTQSKIAIGSGEILGKGFLKGTQTKFDFVPDQSTDFIFCTIGEEHGWIGATLLIIAYVLFLLRLIYLAERQKERFSRIYGYSVASIIFVHFAINIGMTIGIFPVIGIPLPFISYGGSSLWSFTILLFIFLKLDAHRRQILSH
ncbi:MAG: rod shape-determining protein RodA [Cytophagales bacterium]|nr:MAG: rod shape-determining protein RodA [Cytophagales bacterium]